MIKRILHDKLKEFRCAKRREDGMVCSDGGVEHVDDTVSLGLVAVDVHGLEVTNPLGFLRSITLKSKKGRLVWVCLLFTGTASYWTKRINPGLCVLYLNTLYISISTCISMTNKLSIARNSNIDFFQELSTL